MVTVEELQAHVARERRESLAAARAFVRVCASGNADRVEVAAGLLSETLQGWRYAMRRVGKLHSVSQEVQWAFLNTWIEYAHLPLTVGDRPSVAAALRVLMPRNYSGAPLKLFRGATANERARRLYGFSWTTQIDIARNFARLGLDAGLEGVILETVAPPNAILHTREEEGYYDEGEVIVDPFELGRVTVAERLRKA